jgi:peptidoglycan hydrolase CwlO-like protein
MTAPNSITTLPERTSVLEVQVENLEKKVDELKIEVKEDNKEIKDQLKTMYEASCKQHAELGREITEIKKTLHGWVMYILGGSAVISVLVTLYNTFIK